MVESISYFNGKFVPDSECKVHIGEKGFLRGDAVYDLTRTFNGKIHRPKDHLDRLYRSLTFARIDPGMTIDEAEEITHEVIKRNEHLREPGGDFSVRQTVMRGYAKTSATTSDKNYAGRITEKAPSTVCISATPIDFAAHDRHYQTGTHVVFARTRSYAPQSLEPKLKHTSRLNFSLAELEASDVDPDAYPVLLDLDGNITENVAGNFFIVTNGVIRVPTDRSTLQGIARMDVFYLGKQLGIPVSEEDLQPYDAYTADEAFLSNSIYCILPVGRIENRPIKSEIPGPITQRLLAAWSEMVGLDIVDQAQRGSRG